MEKSFLYTAQNPTLDRAREICRAAAGRVRRGRTAEIFVVYTDMENGLEARPVHPAAALAPDLLATRPTETTVSEPC